MRGLLDMARSIARVLRLLAIGMMLGSLPACSANPVKADMTEWVSKNFHIEGRRVDIRVPPNREHHPFYNEEVFAVWYDAPELQKKGRVTLLRIGYDPHFWHETPQFYVRVSLVKKPYPDFLRKDLPYSEVWQMVQKWLNEEYKRINENRRQYGHPETTWTNETDALEYNNRIWIAYHLRGFAQMDSYYVHELDENHYLEVMFDFNSTKAAKDQKWHEDRVSIAKKIMSTIIIADPIEQ